MSAKSGLTGVSWLSCNATRYCWPVSCSSTRTLRTKGEAGLWNSVMLGADMQVSSINGQGLSLDRSKAAGEFRCGSGLARRPEEHTSELQSLMRNSYEDVGLKK